MMRVSNVDLHWQQNLPVSRLHASLSARQQDVADLKADRHRRVVSIGEDGNLVGACEVPCCHVVRAKGCSTEDVGPESNFLHAGGTRLCQLERCVGSQCDVTVGIVVYDADGVLVVVDQLPVAAVPVEAGEGGSIILEVLKTSARGEIGGGVSLNLRDQHLPLLSAIHGQGDLNCEEVSAQVFDGEVEVLTGEHTTELVRKNLVGDRVRSHDCHRFIRAASRYWSSDVKLDKVNPDLLNRGGRLVDRPSVHCVGARYLHIGDARCCGCRCGCGCGEEYSWSHSSCSS